MCSLRSLSEAAHPGSDYVLAVRPAQSSVKESNLDTKSAKRSLPTKTATSIHQLKVTLERSRPPIWRRVLVQSNITLDRLHDTIQLAMGWSDSHLHEFRIGETSYGDQDLLADFDVKNERTTRLGTIAPRPKDRLRYQYDFGDSWDHLILVEAVLPPDTEIHYPICVAGRRACPPEDCGGFWGYADLLDALNDPLHPEHADMTEWMGGSFDPDHFDLEVINRRLEYVRKR